MSEEKKLKEQVEEVLNEIDKRGGLMSFPNSIRRDRPLGCPMRCNTLKEIQEGFANQEYYLAFNLGLIGNNGHEGTIIKNVCKYPYSKGQTKLENII